MTTYDVTGQLTAKVRLGRGQVEVAAGPDAQASATVTAVDPSDALAVAAAGAARVELSGDELSVEVPSRSQERLSPAVRIVIVVPIGTHLSAAAGDVDVSAEVELGDVRLRLGNGSASLGDCTGSVDVKAGNLTLAVGDTDSLSVAAGNAEVRAGAVRDAALRAGAGSLTLAASTGRVTAKGGQVDLTVASTGGGSVDYRAATGSATIGVAAGTGVHLDLVSAVGDVSCSLPVEAGAPAEGAALSLSLHTGAGDLRVHRAGEAPPPPSASSAQGFPDIGRLVEEAMTKVQFQLDRAGLTGVRIDGTGDRARPAWADRIERAVRSRGGTTRTRYVGPLWGTDGPDVTENRTWIDGHEVPVDEAVSEQDVQSLRANGYDNALLAQLPVDGPWTITDLLTVCRAGLEEVVELVAQLPLDGPLSSAGLAALIEDGLEDIVHRVRAAHLDGPVDPDDLLPRFGRESL